MVVDPGLHRAQHLLTRGVGLSRWEAVGHGAEEGVGHETIRSGRGGVGAGDPLPGRGGIEHCGIEPFVPGDAVGLRADGGAERIGETAGGIHRDHQGALAATRPQGGDSGGNGGLADPAGSHHQSHRGHGVPQ